MIKLYTRVKEKLKVYKQQTSKQYKYMNVTSDILRCTYHNNIESIIHIVEML